VKVKKVAYTGKYVKPNPKVTVMERVMKKGSDYTVSYKNNKKIGWAKVIVKGKRNCAGTVSKSFMIVPPKSKASAKASKSGKYTQLTVTLKSKPKCKVTRYRIQIATNKNFTKGLKNGTTKISGKKLYGYAKLKKGKTYYVKVRAYKTYGGKTVYGPWSGYKKIKCK
jgi:hypothetical protein